MAPRKQFDFIKVGGGILSTLHALLSRSMNKMLSTRNWVITLPYIWLLLFFVIPFVMVLRVSFSEEIFRIPPYADIVTWLDNKVVMIKLSFQSYMYLVEDDLYLSSYFVSLKFALATTFLALLIGYPMAYGITRFSPTGQKVFILLIMLPFWTSFLVRIYAWLNLLAPYGLINTFLTFLGIIDRPLDLLYNDVSLVVGMVYCYLPFMVFPIYVTLEKIDPSFREAASDLGAKSFTIFKSVIVPLSLPGVLTGSLLVFIPCVGEFVIPEILGGPDNILVGRMVWNEIFLNRSWPTAAALAVALLVVLFIPIYGLQRLQNKFSQQMEK